jgi:hypothetical protein
MSVLDSLFSLLDKGAELVKEDKVFPSPVVPVVKPDADKVTDDDLKKILVADKDQNVISEELVTEAKKKDPKAAVRNKPNPVFDAKSPKVTDDRDHFPLKNAAHGRNALSRAGAFSEPPKWYKGTLKQFQSAVKKAVHKAFPEIEISKD